MFAHKEIAELHSCIISPLLGVLWVCFFSVLATFNKPAGTISLWAAKSLCGEEFWPGNGEMSPVQKKKR